MLSTRPLKRADFILAISDLSCDNKLLALSPKFSALSWDMSRFDSPATSVLYSPPLACFKATTFAVLLNGRRISSSSFRDFLPICSPSVWSVVVNLSYLSLSTTCVVDDAWLSSDGNSTKACFSILCCLDSICTPTSSRSLTDPSLLLSSSVGTGLLTIISGIPTLKCPSMSASCLCASWMVCSVL